MLSLLLFSIAIGSASNDPVMLVEDQAIVRIRIADYDLTNAAGQKRLGRKIAWAAGKVCTFSIPGAFQLELFACEKETIADARHQLDSVMAQRKSGTPLVAAIAVTANSKR